MKNTLLILVLGLFAVGCYEENPLGPEWDYDGAWRCPHITNYYYDTEGYCESLCEEECYECDAGENC